MQKEFRMLEMLQLEFCLVHNTNVNHLNSCTIV